MPQDDKLLTIDDVANRMAELEAENRFLRWMLGLGIVALVIVLAAQLLR